MNKIDFKKESIETVKFVLILVMIYFVITLAFQYLPFLNQYDTFAIRTDSMEPVIMVGDVVVTKEIDPDEILIGDIIAFKVDITGDEVDDVVVHYIAEINTNGDQLIFKTKPEVSDTLDRWTIEEHDIVGLYQFKVGGIGKILLFADTWIGKGIILVDILVVSIIYDMIKKPDKKKKQKTELKPKEEIEETQNNQENFEPQIIDKKNESL